MKKTYRNAVRSKKLIRQAYWELLSEDPARTVTVTDIVNRADLTRNTFYAHYRDISAVHNGFVSQLLNQLASSLRSAEDANALLHTTADFAQKNRSTLLLLQSSALSDGLKQLLRCGFDTLPSSSSSDLPDAIVTAAVSGMIDLTVHWVRAQDGLTPHQIADQLVRLLKS